jgi:Raf kinase inhibitor-like YbhB/YbcL family protein
VSLLLAAMVLLSQTFTSGSTVPQSMVATPCGGSNVSPQLHWSGVPAGARSLALILHDPDAPHPGGFYHWVFFNLAPDVRSIDAGSQLPALQSGLNGTGNAGYFGPCPPPGKLHHYNFTLYALDTKLDASKPLDAAGLQDRMRGHILAQATLTGTLER